jgi:hypothetical protein
MTFLHPWAIAIGVLAASLPVIIHFLTKPRPVRLPLSTIRFVREAIHQRRARHRLRDFIILALRTLAILLIAWAVARPLWSDRPLVSPTESATASRVVILDCSQSMGATSSGIQLFERARSVAAGYLTDQPTVQGNLILAGASSRPVFDVLSTNFVSLRQELAAAKVRPERLNLQLAINQAAELLGKTPNEPGRKRELVIVSDFQRTSWTGVNFSLLPQDAVIQLESVGPKEALANIAILRVSGPARVEQGREVSLEVDIGNYSPAPRQVRGEVVLGSAVYQLQGMCLPGKTTLTVEVAAQTTGWQSGEVRLLDVQDTLPVDNTRSFVLEVRPLPTFVLLTRQKAEQKPSSSYYLEIALSPSLRAGKKDDRVKRVDPGTLDRDILTAADVIVVDHPGKLSPETIQLLASLLRRGRSIFYIASETVDATNLQLLKQAAGTDLQMPVEFQPPPPGQVRRKLVLAEVKRDQPPFSAFGGDLNAVLGMLQFSGGLVSRRAESGLSDDILAKYHDQTACLVVTACGGGNFAVLNADLGLSNMPKEKPFVTFINELIGRLLGRSRTGDAWACGEQVTLYMPATVGPAQGLGVDGPAPPDMSKEEKAAIHGDLREESAGVVWRIPRAGPPGIYQVQRGGATLFALASGIPPEESDLRPLGADDLKSLMTGGHAVGYHAAVGGDEETQDDFWVWLAVGCVLCLIAELAVLKWFRT